MSDAPARTKPVSGARPPFMAFCSHAESLSVLGQFAQANKWPEACIQKGDATTAAEYLKSNPTPQILFVEVPSAKAAPDLLDKLADVCDPNVKVIVSGTINEYSFYTWLVDIGIANYLLQPFTMSALQAIYDKALTPTTSSVLVGDAKKEAKVISIIGTRGGVGSTMLAVNLSWILAKQHKQKVALLDLDPQVGTVAMALDLEPGRGMRDALEKPDRIDSLFMDRVMVRYDDNLSILSAEEPLEEMIISSEAASEALIRETRKKFSHVIIDVPRQMSPFTRHVLKTSDTVIVLTETTVPGLRDALRLSDYFKDHLKIRQPLFVANREGVAGKHHMSKSDFEKSLGAEISYVIPFVMDVYGATNTGEALLESSKNAPVVKVIVQLVARFVDGADIHEAKPKKDWLSLLKGGK